MQEPRIEFPCDYPIKVIGEASPEFVSKVLQIVGRYDATISPDIVSDKVSAKVSAKVSEKASRNGNYTSVTIRFRATGEAQIKQLFADLQQYKAVHLVL
jgi:putative lipoic acid-binding regulatory protein